MARWGVGQVAGKGPRREISAVLLAIALAAGSSSVLVAPVDASSLAQPCPPPPQPPPPGCDPPPPRTEPPPPAPNRAPIFFGATPANGASLVVLSGGELGFVVEAQDPDGDFVQLSATGVTVGASFPIPQPAASVRTSFRWTPTRGQASAAPYALTFNATDTKGAATSRSIAVTVSAANAAPLIQSPANGSVLEGSVGQTVTFELVASDPDTDQTLTFQITPGITCTGDAPANPLRATCGFAPSQAGTFDAAVTVTDGRSPVVSGFSIVAKAPVPPPPVAPPPVVAPHAPTSWQLVVAFVSGAARATSAPSTCTAGTECVVRAPQDACGGPSPCDVVASSRCDETGSCETSVAGASCGDTLTCPSSRVAFGCGAGGTTCGPTIALARRAWDIALTIQFGETRFMSASTPCVSASSCTSSLVVPSATCGGSSDCVFTGRSECDSSGTCSATFSGEACGSSVRCPVTTATFTCGASICGPVFGVVRPSWDLVVGFAAGGRSFAVPPVRCAAGGDCVVTATVPGNVCGADSACALRVDARCDAAGSCQATVSGCSLCRPTTLLFVCAEARRCQAEFTVEAPTLVAPLWGLEAGREIFGDLTPALWVIALAAIVAALGALTPLPLAGLDLLVKVPGTGLPRTDGKAPRILGPAGGVES